MPPLGTPPHGMQEIGLDSVSERTARLGGFLALKGAKDTILLRQYSIKNRSRPALLASSSQKEPLL